MKENNFRYDPFAWERKEVKKTLTLKKEKWWKFWGKDDYWWTCKKCDKRIIKNHCDIRVEELWQSAVFHNEKHQTNI